MYFRKSSPQRSIFVLNTYIEADLSALIKRRENERKRKRRKERERERERQRKREREKIK